MGYRLGLKLLTPGDCRAEHCSRQQDELGDHALHCRDDHGMKGGRHDRIRDKIFKRGAAGVSKSDFRNAWPHPGLPVASR